MQLANIPSKILKAFGFAGGKNTIPFDSQIGTTPGAASYEDGFPPLTRTPLVSGGVPPSGLDMNGILYESTNLVNWLNAGGGFPYDSAFASDPDVNGYPKGARIMRSDGEGYWLNLADNNTSNPEVAGTNWVPDFVYGAAAITMTSSNVTLTLLQAARPIIVITGTLTGNLNLIFPNWVKTWTVINLTTGSFSITAKTASGSGVAVSQGVASSIVGDGSNISSSTNSLVISSTAQAQAWTDNTTAISPLRLDEALQGSNQVLAAAGRQNFPGGFKLKWGSGVSSGTSRPNVSVTYPLAFPIATTFAIVIPQDTSQSYQGMLHGTPTAGGFTANVCTDTSVNNGINYFWLAGGY